jgi:hypothetical protein
MQTILILRLLGAQSQSLDKTTDEVLKLISRQCVFNICKPIKRNH